MTTTDIFRAQLHDMFLHATVQGKPHLEVTASDLHRAVGGYPGPDHRMPACCSAMKGEMTAEDEILYPPPKGKGASLKILYKLPRPAAVVESAMPESAQPEVPARSGMSPKAKLFLWAGAIAAFFWRTK